jgi:hypothetical protein
MVCMRQAPNDTPDVDLTFQHSYEVQRLELPGSGEPTIPMFNFPLKDHHVEQSGLWLTVRPSNGRTWTGVFAYGYSSPPGLSRIMSCPDPDSVVVISRGAAYRVCPDDPASWEEFPILPVTGAVVSEKHQIMIFAGFHGLAAYGRNGLRWTTTRPGLDLMEILRVDGEIITVKGYDPTGDNWPEFLVDLNTGEERTR